MACLMYYRQESQDSIVQYSARPMEGTQCVFFLKGGMERWVDE